MTLTRQVFLDAGFDELPHSQGGRLGSDQRKLSPHRDPAGPGLQLTSERDAQTQNPSLSFVSSVSASQMLSSPAVLDRRQDVQRLPQQLLKNRPNAVHIHEASAHLLLCRFPTCDSSAVLCWGEGEGAGPLPGLPRPPHV